jgi:hypothetical protein
VRHLAHEIERGALEPDPSNLELLLRHADRVGAVSG